MLYIYIHNCRALSATGSHHKILQFTYLYEQCDTTEQQSYVTHYRKS